MTIRTAARRAWHWDERMSFRSLIRLLLTIGVLAVLAVSIVSNIGLTAAVHGDEDQAKVQSTQIAGLQHRANDLSVALKDAAAVIERRSPTYSFFVCWAARVGDLFDALPALSSQSTPAQLAVFAQIAARTRTALTYTDQGGCLDRSVPVTIPQAIRIPDR